MPVSQGGKLYFTPEQKDAALRNTSALEYARGKYELKQVGNEYRMKEHDSMVFTRDGRWFWNSRGIHGNAIDFIVHYEGKTYTEAVLILAGETGRQNLSQQDAAHREPPSAPRPFVLPEPAGNCRMLFAYLIKTRGLDAALIQHLVQEKRLLQVRHYGGLQIAGYGPDKEALYLPVRPEIPAPEQMHRIVTRDRVTPVPEETLRCYSSREAAALADQGVVKRYADKLAMLGYDAGGVARYCSLRSMNPFGKAYKSDAVGSSKKYPFVLPGRDNGTLVVVESPIEAMSYRCLCRISRSSRGDFPILALGGVNAQMGLEQYLQDHPQTGGLILALNRDADGRHRVEAGEIGTEKLMQKYRDQYQITVHQPYLNDWNDVLCRVREVSPGKEQPERKPARDGPGR